MIEIEINNKSNVFVNITFEQYPNEIDDKSNICCVWNK